MSRALALILTAMLFPSVALAQLPVGPPRYGFQASQQHSPGGFPLLGYSREISGRWITEFYAMSRLNAESEPVVFARQALDSYESQEHIRWADSRNCPALMPQLLRANDLALPVVLIPLDEPSRTRRSIIGSPAAPAADGPGPYVFWAIAFGPAGGELRLSTFGGPWHAWANDMEADLQPCWADEMPRIGPAR